MVSRRTLLQGAVAATSLPIIAGASWLSHPAGPLPAGPVPAQALEYPSLYKVLFDWRFAPARRFGQDAHARGQPVHAFDGDVTDIWYHDLYTRWRNGKAPIAGFTAYGAFFCLEHLARDARMRVVHQSEHRYAGHEMLYSWVIA